MAIVTFLFSFLARKANDIIQAIFGWSVTALFGKLPRRSQILVTGALVLSLAWPLFVIGVFLPKLAAWAVALVPLHDVIGTTALRIIWIVLAAGSPLLIGFLVWYAAPKRKGGVARALINGYPIALGFFLAFLIVLVTVPVIKIASLVRRWTDVHVYVQPHEHRYRDVINALAEATARAGEVPTIEEAPRYMVLATSVMRKFAGGAVAPFVSDTLKRIVAPDLQLYLYPGDLLMRGDAKKVAHVRTMIQRTKLEHFSYLVGDASAQKIQGELSALDRILDEAEPAASGRQLVTRLETAYRQLMKSDIPYEDAVILDAMSRQVERRLLHAKFVDPDALPIDSIGDHLAQIEEALHDAHEEPAWLPHGAHGGGTAVRHVNRRA